MSDIQCPRCGYDGPATVMFEVSGRKDFGRIVHVAIAKEQYVSGTMWIRSLCGRRFSRGSIFGGVDHGIIAYDPARAGLCSQCVRVHARSGRQRS